MTLGELLESTVRRRGDRTFLLDHRPPAHSRDAADAMSGASERPGGKTLTYSEFDRLVNGLAGGLRQLGLQEGDPIGCILPNSPETLLCWFAAAKLGAVLVPLNPALTTSERSVLLRHAHVKVLVCESSAVESHKELPGTAAIVAVGDAVPGTVAWTSLCTEAGQPPTTAVAPDSAVCVLYTSGTSGSPKGCVLTHRSFVLPAQEFGRWMRVTADDRFFGCMPLFHIAGQSFAVSAVAAGASLVLVDGFRGSRFWEQVRSSGATLFRHLGEMIAVLSRQPVEPGERAHTLRAAYGGGARREVAEAFEGRFGVPVVEGYGLTETNTVCRNDLDGRVPGSIGTSLPYCEIRIADGDGLELPPGEVGEIQVRRNPVMMTGYLRAPELTALAFAGEWFRTGDLGHRGDGGHLYFVARVKEIIRRRGENIMPAEIEQVLDRHPGVARCAVVPVADELGGEEAKAFVVPSAGTALRVDDLVDWCRPSLAEFKIPRFFEICSGLPHTATNKVNKAVLRARSTLGGECHDRGVKAPVAP